MRLLFCIFINSIGMISCACAALADNHQSCLVALSLMYNVCCCNQLSL